MRSWHEVNEKGGWGFVRGWELNFRVVSRQERNEQPWISAQERTNGDRQEQLNRTAQSSNSCAAFWSQMRFASLGFGFSHLWKRDVQQPLMAMIQSRGNVYSKGKIWSCECVGCERGLQAWAAMQAWLAWWRVLGAVFLNGSTASVGCDPLSFEPKWQPTAKAGR
jgi:hypothetical protein